MPASTADPISSALKQTFHNGGYRNGTSSLESSLQATSKKNLLAAIQFDPPVRHVSGIGANNKSKYIILNPQNQVTFLCFEGNAWIDYAGIAPHKAGVHGVLQCKSTVQ